MNSPRLSPEEAHSRADQILLLAASDSERFELSPAIRWAGNSALFILSIGLLWLQFSKTTAGWLPLLFTAIGIVLGIGFRLGKRWGAWGQLGLLAVNLVYWGARGAWSAGVILTTLLVPLALLIVAHQFWEEFEH